MPDILHRIAIKAPTETVFAALSTREGLAGWWTTNVKASANIGAVNQFRFDDRGSNDMEVVELIAGKRVKWRCVDGASEWIGTELIFELNYLDGHTVVLFAQRGWREPGEFMHYCSTKWAVYLLSLKQLCETGTGAPYPNDIDIG